MTPSPDISVTAEATPNPATMQFRFSKQVLEDRYHFSDAMEAEQSPLAAKLFGFPWVSEIFLGPDFVSVSKQEWVEWPHLAEPLANLIAEHLNSGLPVLLPQTESPDESEQDSPLVRNIKRVIANEIRPVVGMDGGDVVFAKFEDGTLYLHMRGACAGCPSKSVTLKEGIETRMREVFPEIEQVVSL